MTAEWVTATNEIEQPSAYTPCFNMTASNIHSQLSPLSPEPASLRQLIFTYPATQCEPELNPCEINLNLYTPYKALPTSTQVGLLGTLDVTLFRLLDQLPQFSVAIVQAHTQYDQDLLKAQADLHIQRLAKDLPQEQRNFRTFSSRGTFTRYVVIQAASVSLLHIDDIKDAMRIMFDYYDNTTASF
jgi:hypothetical protein